MINPFSGVLNNFYLILTVGACILSLFWIVLMRLMSGLMVWISIVGRDYVDLWFNPICVGVENMRS